MLLGLYSDEQAYDYHVVRTRVTRYSLTGFVGYRESLLRWQGMSFASNTDMQSLKIK